MNRKTFALLLSISAMCLHQSAVNAVNRGQRKFDVEIKLMPVSTAYAGRNRYFFVDTFVTNITDKDQDVTVWTQTGWSWLSNNPNFSPGIEALKNSPKKITLKPGQNLHRQVEIWTGEHLKNASNNKFKLGFVASATRPVSGIADPKDLDPNDVYWSRNWVTYKIQEGK